MGVLIHRGYSTVECDHFDGKESCRAQTEPHHGEQDGQQGVRQWAERLGWRFNYDNGRATCPKHR